MARYDKLEDDLYIPNINPLFSDVDSLLEWMNSIKIQGMATEVAVSKLYDAAADILEQNNECEMQFGFDREDKLKWDSKMSSNLQDNSTGCNQQVVKKTLENASSFVMATSSIFWILTDMLSQSSTIQLQQLHQELSPVFEWLFPLVELLGFVLFVLVIGTMILVGAQITRLQSAMLLFWAILMLVRSIDSLSALYVSIIGIILIGWHMLIEKQPAN